MIEVRPTTTRELGSAEARSLQAFQEACRVRELRGGAPEGISWSPMGGWADGWTPATASPHLLRRHMRNMALMACTSPVLPEQGGTHRTPEVEREITAFLHRKRQADERRRDRIRSQAV